MPPSNPRDSTYAPISRPEELEQIDLAIWQQQSASPVSLDTQIDIRTQHTDEEPIKNAQWCSSKPVAGNLDEDETSTSLPAAPSTGFHTTNVNNEKGPSDILGQQCKIHWVSPTNMVGLFFCGIAFAVGHHIYYKSLAVTIIDDLYHQEKAKRYGNALAFLSKTCLAAAVSVAYHQQIWRTFRVKALSVGAIDAAFSAATDLTALMRWELIVKANIGAALAFSIWLLPITALITPATLSISPAFLNTTTYMDTPVLNFSTYNRGATFQYFQQYNTPSGPTGISSPTLDRIFTLATTGAAILPMPAIIQQPSGYYSYQVLFRGPSLKCSNLNDTERVVIDTLADALVANWSRKTNGSEATKRHHGFSAYWILQYLAFPPPSPGVVDVALPESVSAYVSDCLVSNSPPVNENPTICSEDVLTAWIWADHQSWTCTFQHALFEGHFATFGNMQSVEINDKATTWNPINDAGDDEWDDELVDIISPVLFMLYGSIGAEFYYQNEDRTLATIGVTVTSTTIEQTALFGALNFNATLRNLLDIVGSDNGTDANEAEKSLFGYNGVSSFQTPSDRARARNLTLYALIEELLRNLSASYLSDKTFWSDPGQGFNASVHISQPVNRYVYNRRTLLCTYFAAIITSLSGVLVGIRAYILNGVSYSTNFSAQLRATRNPTLSYLTQGQSLGADPLPQALQRTNLKFGLITVPEDGSHPGIKQRRAAFGIESEVDTLPRGSTNWAVGRRRKNR